MGRCRSAALILPAVCFSCEQTRENTKLRCRLEILTRDCKGRVDNLIYGSFSHRDQVGPKALFMRVGCVNIGGVP